MAKADVSKVLKAFSRLETKQMKAVHRRALNRAGTILVNQTRKNIRQQVKSKKSLKVLLKGVRKKVNRKVTEVKVNIMGDYRLKWLEMGTAERYVKSRKKGGYVKFKKKRRAGRITATRFFEKAQNQVNKIVPAEMEKTLLSAIEKQFNKK